MSAPDKNRLSLGIRQPWVELILRGIKTIEVRTVNTAVTGTIYLYASRKLAAGDAALAAAQRQGLDVAHLPTGLIVGTVDIVECRACVPGDVALAQVDAELLAGKQAWVLANARRLKEPLKPRFLPYGIWFYPFQRRNGSNPATERRGGYGRR